ncbi:HSF-type DNA-binding-domain-containing protein [Halteromyces radiatus]|uniref:HSF-type DNA-binding-domain-containing protein n=1 Tax=Halteromyces radiatus TaxID=101107 RepID=UPI00221F1861|nr:HSF-type DNA-binding-domain-containing protein [Halteromyces radiatus]KAI8097098.1 HSF-type DNA-binding-domain-containing protein [Halteromyces radiatus]
MTNLPEDNTSIPSQVTNYTNLISSTSPFYSNFHHPFDYQDTQQQGSTTSHRMQSIVSPLGYLPNVLLSYQSASLDDNNNHDLTTSNYNNYTTVSNYTTPPMISTKNSFWQSTSSHRTIDSVTILNNPTVKINNMNHAERGIAGFVSKLYQCLQAPDNGHKYARWCLHDDKDMFVIDCIPRFTEEVLPRLFKHCKFPSFVRQLNIYGFQRDTDARKSKDTKDKETCRWYHPYFRPGRRDLFHLIRRKSTQHSRRKRIPMVEQDSETILTMDSGEDDSDSDDKCNQRRLSSVSSSLSNSIIQQDYSFPSSLLEQQHQLQGELIQDENLIHHPPLPSNDTQEGSTTISTRMSHTRSDDEVTKCISQHDDYIKQTYLASNFIEEKTTTINDDLTKEQQLQQQLRQLQNSYNNDREFFTKQIRLAYAHIEEQRVHIAQLEAISAHRQYQHGKQQQQQQQQQQQHRHHHLRHNHHNLQQQHQQEHEQVRQQQRHEEEKEEYDQQQQQEQQHNQQHQANHQYHQQQQQHSTSFDATIMTPSINNIQEKPIYNGLGNLVDLKAEPNHQHMYTQGKFIKLYIQQYCLLLSHFIHFFFSSHLIDRNLWISVSTLKTANHLHPDYFESFHSTLHITL